MRRVTGSAAAVLIFLAALLGAQATPLPQGNSGSELARSLATAEQHLGPTSPDLLPILAPLAQLRYEQGNFAAATSLRRRSLKIAIAAFGSGSVQAAAQMAALARLYIERRRYLDAEPLAIAATNILCERLGGSDPALAPVLADRARIALAQGSKDRAQKWAEEAIAIEQQSQLGPRSERLRVLGAVLATEGKFEDAERVLGKALSLDRETGDPLATARSLARLANAYLRQKKFNEALPLIEEAASLDQAHLAPSHPLIAEDFHDLGLIYLGTNRPNDAVKAFATAIDVLACGAGRRRRPSPISSSTSLGRSTLWAMRTRLNPCSTTPAAS